MSEDGFDCEVLRNYLVHFSCILLVCDDENDYLDCSDSLYYATIIIVLAGKYCVYF